MPFLAYKITHRYSGKAYIGITTRTLEARWNGHFYQGKGRIGAAVRKYGRDAFDVEHIASALSLPDLMAVERDLIASHMTLAPAGYNLCSGGEGTLSPSDETRNKMSLSAKARTGRSVSQETREKIASSLAGHSMSAATRAKISKAKVGTIVSEGTRLLLSELRTGRKLPKRTPEQVAAMSARLIGRKRDVPLSEEARKKISIAAAAHWAIRKREVRDRFGVIG